ncbi:hypothetical protein, partial [Halobacterium hubeiense]
MNADQRLCCPPQQNYRRFNEGFFAEGVVSVVARTARSGGVLRKIQGESLALQGGDEADQQYS